MTHACVYWLKERLTSIVHIDKVPVEDRFKGAITRVKFSDGKDYPAKIVAVSDNMRELEEQEDSFMSQLEKSEGKEVTRGHRMNKSSKTNTTDVATGKQVALALGEKPRLDNKQHASMKKLADTKKVTKKNQTKSEGAFDLALLDMDKPTVSKSANVHQDDSPENITGIKSDLESDIEKLHATPMEDEEMNKPREVTASCSTCSTLIAHRNTAVKEFVWDLGLMLGMDLKTSPSKTADTGKRLLQVLPVPKNEKKIELTPNSGLWLPKSAKSRLLLTCDGDPYKLARQTVEVLYGKDALRQHDVTAVGLAPGSRGVGSENLEAIYRFVKRNTPWDRPPTKKNGRQNQLTLTFARFTREINRKIISLRRTQKHCSSDKENTDKRPGKRPRPKSDESAMRTPTKVGNSRNTWQVTPVKLSSTNTLRRPNSVSSPATEEPPPQHAASQWLSAVPASRQESPSTPASMQGASTWAPIEGSPRTTAPLQGPPPITAPLQQQSLGIVVLYPAAVYVPAGLPWLHGSPARQF